MVVRAEVVELLDCWGCDGEVLGLGYALVDAALDVGLLLLSCLNVLERHALRAGPEIEWLT